MPSFTLLVQARSGGKVADAHEQGASLSMARLRRVHGYALFMRPPMPRARFRVRTKGKKHAPRGKWNSDRHPWRAGTRPAKGGLKSAGARAAARARWAFVLPSLWPRDVSQVGTIQLWS